MQGIGCLLLASGWLIALAALSMLHSLGQRYGFVFAGLIVEILGVGILAHACRAAQLARRDD